MAIENLKCPACGSPMIPRTGKHGTFWGCQAYPRCKSTRDSLGRSRDERLAAVDDTFRQRDRRRGD